MTDVPNGFHLEGPNLTVEGEKVEFNCSVSVYHYTKDITWKLNGRTFGEDHSKFIFSCGIFLWVSTCFIQLLKINFQVSKSLQRVVCYLTVVP